MNTSFLIEDTLINEAQKICSGFENANVASSSIASCVAAALAERFFAGAGVETDTESGLYKNEAITKEFEISDIYINGNYVDARVYFDEHELCVPKSHFDREIVPLVYMFVKLSKDLSSAEITGFLLPDMITRIDDVDGYYTINENALIPFEEISYLFREQNDTYNVDDEEIFSFLEGTNENTLSFVKKLILSKDGRIRFEKAFKAQAVLSLVEISQSVSTPNYEPVATPEITDFADLITVPEESFENTEDFSEPVQEDSPSFDVDISYGENQDESIKQEEIQDFTGEDENYNFTTVPSPKFNESEYEEFDEFETLEKDIEATDAQQVTNTNPEQSEEISTLFDSDNAARISGTKKKSSPLLIIVLLLLILGGTGYWSYTNIMQQPKELPSNNLDTTNLEQVNVPDQPADAMPVETVEKAVPSASKNEGNSVSIPVIEKNLDASILVSNLRVEWDVPSGYKTNTQAIRYLTKMGKIIQLHLKSELLLLNKPPISNKISIELKYDPVSKNFDTVDFVNSSGEKDVDDIIMHTVKKSLETKLSINADTFGKLSGNPVIIIKL